MPERDGARVEVKRFFIALVIALNLLLADAVTKECAVHFLKGEPSVSLIPGFLDLAYVENRGCAWGMFQGHVWPLALFSAVMLVFLVLQRRNLFDDGGAFGVSSRLGAVLEPLLYAGIVGNMIDRIFRGFVVDMIDVHWGVHHFPCFNLADSYISVASFLIVLTWLFEKKGSRKA